MRSTRLLISIFLGTTVCAQLAAQCPIHQIHGQGSPELGWSASIAGDVDRDGFADVIHGNPGQARAHVFSLSDPDTDIWTIQGSADRLGHAVDGAGDVDGDGFPDLLVGAPMRTTTAGTSAGSVLVISGKDGTELHSISGVGPDDHLGWSVAGLGDIDGDGEDDFIGGAPEGAAGYALVVSGADGSILSTLTSGTGEDESFGFAVASAGDVDNDGTPDILIGAPEQDSPTDSGAGSVWVFSGSDFSILHQYYGRGPDYGLGYDLDGIGDVNEDGHDDFVVGEPFNTTAGFEGLATVFTGKTGSVLYNLGGHGSFGRALSGLGDVDGDSIPDLAVASPELEVAGDPMVGIVTLFKGSNGAFITFAYGHGAFDNFGFSVGGGGDVNGNGTNDFLIGAPSLDGNGDSSRFWVFLKTCGGHAEYGESCPSSQGQHPILQMEGLATPFGELTIDIINGLPDSSAFIFFGLGHASIPLAGGCTLNISPVLPIMVGPLALGSTGSRSFSAQVPGGTPTGIATLQAFVADPALPWGYSATNGVSVHIE